MQAGKLAGPVKMQCELSLGEDFLGQTHLSLVLKLYSKRHHFRFSASTCLAEIIACHHNIGSHLPIDMHNHVDLLDRSTFTGWIVNVRKSHSWQVDIMRSWVIIYLTSKERTMPIEKYLVIKNNLHCIMQEHILGKITS